MSFIFSLIFFFFLFYVLRGLLALWRTKRQVQDFFRQAGQAAGFQQQAARSERKAGWTAPLRRRKKIDPQVGEYVEFTETVIVSTDSEPKADSGHTRPADESQVTDAQWEEIR